MNDVKLTEAELRDYIIGNLYWLGTASREQATAWMDDAIATHTQYEGMTAEELGKERWNVVAMRNAAIERAEAAEARVKELEAVTNHLRILDENTGQSFKAMFTNARKHPVYWTEAVELLQERITELEAEIGRMKEEHEQDGMEKDLNT
jgi:hypothetical protein